MRAALALGAACLGVSPVFAQNKPDKPPNPPVDTVHLQFGWPVGLNARVTAQKLRTRSRAAKPDTSNVQITYQLTVQPHTRGRLVRFHGFEVPGIGPLGAIADLEERLSAMMPSVIVDTTGAFVGIDGVDALRRELNAQFAPYLERADTLPAGVRALLERLSSREVLSALTEYEWNALVGTWIEADFVVGLIYKREYEQPFALVPGVMIPIVQDFVALGRVPCRPADAERRCVELESRLHYDKDAFRRALDSLMSQVVSRDSAGIEDYEFEYEMRLIAEPATLIPHMLVISKRVTMRIKAPRGAREETTQSDTKTTHYEYPARRP